MIEGFTSVQRPRATKSACTCTVDCQRESHRTECNPWKIVGCSCHKVSTIDVIASSGWGVSVTIQGRDHIQWPEKAFCRRNANFPPMVAISPLRLSGG